MIVDIAEQFQTVNSNLEPVCSKVLMDSSIVVFEKDFVESDLRH